MIINMVGGKSGGSSVAAVKINYPAGSICTIENSQGKKFTAKNTDGKVLFSLPQTGVWTAKAGTLTKSITVADEEVYEITLADAITLDYMSFSTKAKSGSTVTIDDTGIRVPSGQGEGDYIGIAYSEGLDATDYLKVKFAGTVTKAGSSAAPKLCVWTTEPTAYNTARAKEINITGESAEIDISSIEDKSNLFVGFYIPVHTYATGTTIAVDSLTITKEQNYE